MPIRVGILVAAVLLAGLTSAYAQSSALASAGAGPNTADLCNAREPSASVSDASLIQEPTGTMQHKSWQPPGGEVRFALRTTARIPADAQVLVCFRWTGIADRSGGYLPVRPDRLDLSLDGKFLEVVVTVPRNLGDAPSPSAEGSGDGGFSLVPKADVRILVLPRGGEGTPVVDLIASIGVVNPLWGALLSLGALLVVLVILSMIGRSRLRDRGPIIRIISTREGRASLSRLQLILWTLVVATSAIYVMAASGELLHVTEGTLALLGISGVVGVGSEIHRSVQSRTDQMGPRRPRWSDLVVRDGAIDISRVQMLYFTLITATFVVLRVAATYVIPEIPTGFQTLIGLSSAVYMGAKLAKTGMARGGMETDTA